MELILLKDVEKVGQKGEVIRVREGFGRNFLIPRRLAVLCTRANQQFVEEQKNRNLARREKEKTQASSQAEKLTQLKLVLEARAGDQNKLFGSITNEDIREALNRQGYAVDRKHIHLKEAIHSLGSYTVTIELYPEVKTNVTVEVVRKS